MKAMLLQKVPAADGVELATDVWLPDGPGPFPVLLTRTPYDRKGGGDGGPALYTDWGYAYVVQDCRGKFESGGVFRPLVDEAADGAATLDWVAEQKWCNGRIGMVGRSYLSMVQVPAAASGHEALRCICPSVGGETFLQDWVRHGGCFRLANVIRWPMTHTSCRTTHPTDHYTWEELWAAGSLGEVFERAGYESPDLRDFVEHELFDEYWQRVDQRPMYPRVLTAGLHPGGWFDHVSHAMFNTYQGLRDRGGSETARTGQRLMIGPWPHQMSGRQYGEWDFGPDADLSLLHYQRRFTDLWLRDIDDGIADDPPVMLFVMGHNRWMHFTDWPVPEAQEQRWHLRVGGLSQEGPGAEPPDRYRYDPEAPAPTLGGPIYWGMGRPAGPVDQRLLLGRPDVLYYRSQPLAHETAVIGPIALDLWVRSDRPDTDFIAKLCVVDAPGRVVCLRFGSLQCSYRSGWEERVPLPAGEPVRIRIDMGNLAYVFPPGSRIALTVTSSSFPRILPHPNTMAPTWTETSPKVATNEVLHDPDHPSCLLLPVVDL